MSADPRSMRRPAERDIRTKATLEGAAEVSGYVYAPGALDERFVVELVADGVPIDVMRADVRRDDLASSGVSDGCYGFLFALDASVAAGTTVLDVRLANTGEPVGEPLRLDETAAPEALDERFATVRWLGGLRFAGALPKGHDDPSTIARAIIDGQVVAEARPDGWTHVEQGKTWYVARSFDLHLPERFADGRVRHVDVVMSDGTLVSGSPSFVVAFPDGLERFIRGHAEVESETIRARYGDALTPQSLPFAAHEGWSTRFPRATPAEHVGGTVAVVFVGDANLDGSIDSLRAQVGAGWVAAALPNTTGQGTFAIAELLAYLRQDARNCATVVFALSGTRLAPDALAVLDGALAAFPEASAVYSDIELTSGRQAWPLFFPAFDYERCLEQGYCALFFGLRREALLTALEAGASDVFRIFNAHLDGAPSEAQLPVHAPGALATLPPLLPRELTAILAQATDRHARARGRTVRLAANPGAQLPGVRVGRVPERARVSILVPTRNRLDLLEPCLASLRATVDDDDVEIVIVDNGSTDPALLAFYQGTADPRVRIVFRPGPFNFAALVNAGAELATGDVLLLLNNDAEAMEPGWLGEMLGRLSEPEVGAVGALLVWPTGIVQHGGIVLGPHFSATEAFKDRLQGDAGYGDLLKVAHECSAVTAACLMTRRHVFLERGGFDAVRFPVDYNDVDYCLRLRAAGFRVVFTPHARLLHRESASRGRDERPDQKARAARDRTVLRNRWGEVLMADPFYSPLLSLDTIPYSALAWPPRPTAPRQRHHGAGKTIPPGF